MLKSILKTSVVSLLAVVIAGLPAPLLAQTTNQPAVEKKAAAEKKEAPKGEKKKLSGHPFRGKLAAVDNVAKTIKIGASTYQITSETKILKAGKPATLADGVKGDEVGGYAKPGERGTMVATSLRFGPKTDGTSAGKAKDSAPSPADKTTKK